MQFARHGPEQSVKGTEHKADGPLDRTNKIALPLFEIALVLVRLDHIARHRKRGSQHYV